MSEQTFPEGQLIKKWRLSPEEKKHNQKVSATRHRAKLHARGMHQVSVFVYDDIRDVAKKMIQELNVEYEKSHNIHPKDPAYDNESDPPKAQV